MLSLMRTVVSKYLSPPGNQVRKAQKVLLLLLVHDYILSGLDCVMVTYGGGQLDDEYLIMKSD